MRRHQKASRGFGGKLNANTIGELHRDCAIIISHLRDMKRAPKGERQAFKVLQKGG
jgi:hypothetical protein